MRWKEVNIITAEVCIDHVYMFVEILQKISILLFIRFLKGESSLIIYSRWAIWNTNIEIDYFGVVLFFVKLWIYLVEL